MKAAAVFNAPRVTREKPFLRYNRSPEGIRVGKLLAGDLPPGAVVIGHVTRGLGDSGAVVRLPSGREVQVTCGVIRELPWSRRGEG